MSIIQGQQGQPLATAKGSTHPGTCVPQTMRRGCMQPAASLPPPSHNHPSVTSPRIHPKVSMLGSQLTTSAAHHTRGVMPIQATCAVSAPVSSSDASSTCSGEDVTAALSTLDDAIGEDDTWTEFNHPFHPSPAKHNHVHQKCCSSTSHQPTAQPQARHSQGHLQPCHTEDVARGTGPHSGAPQKATMQQQQLQAAQRSEDLLLSRQIKACRTWRALWSVFQESQRSLNHVHLTALAGGMAKAPLGPAASTAEEQDYRRCMEEVLCAVPPHLPYCQPRELSTLAWAAAKAGAWMQTGKQAARQAPRGRVSEVWAASADRMPPPYQQHPPGAEWWALMMAAIQAQLPRFNPQDLSMTLWAVARACGAGDPDLQNAPPPFALAQPSPPHTTSSKPAPASSSNESSSYSSSSSNSSSSLQGRGTFASESAGSSTQGVGMQHAQPSLTLSASGQRRQALITRLPDGFLEAVVASMAKSMDAFGPQALSNSLWALVSLRCRPGTRWLCAFVKASAHQMPRAAPQALANTAWALTLMEAPLTPQWQTAFFSAAAATAPTAPSASLAQILWAAARLKLQPPTAWVEAMVAPLLACAGAPAALATADGTAFPTSGAAPASAGSSTNGRRAETAGGAALVPQDLANAVFAVAHLGKGVAAQAHPQVMHSLLRSCSSRARTFSVRELAAIITACGVARFSPGREVLLPMLSAFGGRMHQAGSQAVANVLWAVARLGVGPPPAWIEGCVSTLAAEMGDVGPQEVANVWWALGVLRYRPHPTLCADLGAELSQQVEAMKAEEVVMVLSGHARLGIPIKKESLDSLTSCVVSQQRVLWGSRHQTDMEAAKLNLAATLSALAQMERNISNRNGNTASRNSNGNTASSSNRSRNSVSSSSSSSSSARASGDSKVAKTLGASGRSQLPAVRALLMQSIVRRQQASPPKAVQQQQVQQPTQEQQQEQQRQVQLSTQQHHHQQQGLQAQKQQQQQQQQQQEQQSPMPANVTQHRPVRSHRRYQTTRQESTDKNLTSARPSAAESLPLGSSPSQMPQVSLYPPSGAAQGLHTQEQQHHHQPQQQPPSPSPRPPLHHHHHHHHQQHQQQQHSPWQLRADGWTHGDLAVVLYALARLRAPPPHEWASAALTHLRDMATSTQGISSSRCRDGLAESSSSNRNSSSSSSRGGMRTSSPGGVHGSKASTDTISSSSRSSSSSSSIDISRAALRDLSMLAWSVAQLCRLPQPRRLILTHTHHPDLTQISSRRRLARAQAPALGYQNKQKLEHQNEQKLRPENKEKLGSQKKQELGHKNEQQLGRQNKQKLTLSRQRLRAVWWRHPSTRPLGLWRGEAQGRGWSEALIVQLAAVPSEAWHALETPALLGLAWALGYLWSGQPHTPANIPTVSPSSYKAPASSARTRQQQQQQQQKPSVGVASPGARSQPQQQQQKQQQLQQQQQQQQQQPPYQQLSSQQQNVKALLVNELQQRTPFLTPSQISRALTSLSQLLGPHSHHHSTYKATRLQGIRGPPSKELTASHYTCASSSTAQTLISCSSAIDPFRASPGLSKSLPSPHPSTTSVATHSEQLPLAHSPSLSSFLASLTAPPSSPSSVGPPLHAYDARALCSLLMALGRLRAPASPEWLLVACKQLQARLQPISPPPREVPQAVPQKELQAVLQKRVQPMSLQQALTQTVPQAVPPRVLQTAPGTHLAAARPAAAAAWKPSAAARSAAARGANGYTSLAVLPMSAGVRLSVRDCEYASKGLQQLQRQLAHINQQRYKDSKSSRGNNISSRSSTSSSNSSSGTLEGEVRQLAHPRQRAAGGVHTGVHHHHHQQQQIEVASVHQLSSPSTTRSEQAASEPLGLGTLGAQRKQRKGGRVRQATAQQQQEQLLQQVEGEAQQTRVLLRHARAAALRQAREGRLELRIRMFMLPSCQPKRQKSEAI